MAGLNCKEYVKERYEHLKKCYGEFDPYTAGYADCMRAMERQKRKERTEQEETDGV